MIKLKQLHSEIKLDNSNNFKFSVEEVKNRLIRYLQSNDEPNEMVEELKITEIDTAYDLIIFLDSIGYNDDESFELIFSLIIH